VTLVELMVALGIGLALIAIMLSVYLSTSGASRRQEQISSIQNSVRVAFEYLASDARMIGHEGCNTRATLPASVENLDKDAGAAPLAYNFGVGVEGWNFVTPDNALTLGGDTPADDPDVGQFEESKGAAIHVIPLTTISATGLTPGSDVLVMRSVTGRPIRLTAAAPIGNAARIENVADGTCPGGTTAKVSGFCQNSYGLIAGCASAQYFRVQSIATDTVTLTTTANLAKAYDTTAEVFPAQTVVYYVRLGSNGTSPSLYRRTFDGTSDAGLEEELIAGVESLQVRYGLDTTVPPDHNRDGDYVTASEIENWSNVVAVRMSLLLRSDTVADSSLTLPTSTPMNGLTITYPAGGARFDRRVFTTTVALRNKVAFF
jgi:type IV pilus assembly protein PilW